MEDEEERKAMLITDTQWKDVEVLLSLLDLFADATAPAASKDHSIAIVLSLYNSLYLDLDSKLKDFKYQLFFDGIKAAMKVLSKYYALTCHALSAALVLDAKGNLYMFDNYKDCAGHECMPEGRAHVKTEMNPYLEKNFQVSSSEEEGDIFGCHAATIDELAL